MDKKYQEQLATMLDEIRSEFEASVAAVLKGSEAYTSWRLKLDEAAAAGVIAKAKYEEAMAAYDLILAAGPEEE